MQGKCSIGFKFGTKFAVQFKMVLLLILLSSYICELKAEGIETVNNLSFDFYSQENGLPNNQIHSILQDKRGWMWFGTSQGACRFDGYKFTVFKSDPDDTTSLKGSLVRAIYEDKKGQLWIGTENGGLNKFDREKEKFSHLFYSGKETQLRDASVTSILEDNSGNLWVGTEQHLYLIQNEKTISEIKPSNLNRFVDYFRILRTDKTGRIWMGTNHGLFVYDLAGNSARKVVLSPNISLNEEIWDVWIDDDGSVWVGTYADGIFVVNPTTFDSRHIKIDENNDRSNTVRSIAKDRNGKYWIGTRGGLYIYDKLKGVTGFYYHDEREPKSLVNNSIQCIYHDLKGDVWIGTRNGINFLVEERQNIYGYKSMPGDNRYLNSSESYAFWVDPKGDIWVGTESGGINILDRNTNRFRYIQPQKGNPNSLSRNCIKALLDDGNNNLWIGTFLGGLDVLNLRTNTFRHYTHNAADPASLSDNKVWALLKDYKNEIWIGTTAGLDKFEPSTNSFKHFPNLSEGQVNWLGEDDQHCLWIGSNVLVIYNPADQNIVRVSESTRSMLQDSKKRFWLATLNRGIALYSKEKGIIRFYNEKNGLSNNQTQAILEDNDHFLWISTTNGLSKFDPEKEQFHNFYLKNGFQNNQFYGAAYKTKKGELLLGGISGFNIFDPAKIKLGKFSAPIVLTDFKIFNKSVKIGDKKSDVLTKCISETEKIKLKYNQNSITLDFASFDYANSQSIQYAYKLENFDKDWTEPSVNHSANYTNLDPGEYTFRVKTVSIDRQENNSGPELKIIVLPPYWKTWWFRLLMFIALVGIIYLFIAFLVNKEKLKNDLVLEKLKANKLHELDMMKLRFYTNISHEIRTPLTLILGPLEKMKNNMISPSEIKGHVDVMHRNAVQLLQLINQLLDFRKMETGNLKLNLTQGDLVSFVSETVGSFEKLAEEKEIELKFNSLKKRIVTNFDSEKVGKIMNNLLSNAFKFTGKGGKITVNLSLVFDSAENDLVGNSDEKRLIEITVKDTGIGISESNLEKIFVRFFQIGENQSQTGTGIGLALTKELVKLHNGKLFVTSKHGKGSKFTVQLPYEEVAVPELEGSVVSLSAPTTGCSEKAIAEDQLSEQILAEKKIMLLVDDNADVRYFIKSHFQGTYQVLEAENGVEGWDVALRTIPDIIVSDILMPDMDGYEFCRKIRKDERTSHIPVILLTALGSREHEIEGLSYGADDYITKPFDLVILQTKIENILSVRQSLKQKYTGEILLQPRNIILSSPDERFLQKAIDVIEANIADPDLDIERFASEIGVSRMQLYRKLNALTEMTVKEFVRSIRLKRAAQLLVQRKLNISEVAYAVGFRDLSHFRKCFRQEFGMSASEYVDKHGE